MPWKGIIWMASCQYSPGFLFLSELFSTSCLRFVIPSIAQDLVMPNIYRSWAFVPPRNPQPHEAVTAMACIWRRISVLWRVPFYIWSKGRNWHDDALLAFLTSSTEGRINCLRLSSVVLLEADLILPECLDHWNLQNSAGTKELQDATTEHCSTSVQKVGKCYWSIFSNKWISTEFSFHELVSREMFSSFRAYQEGKMMVSHF